VSTQSLHRRTEVSGR